MHMGDAHQARRLLVSYIGYPIHFSAGQFAGHTVRTELIEVQQADLGRKYVPYLWIPESSLNLP